MTDDPAPALVPIANPFTAAHRGGEGTPMVCVHGFTDTWRTWELVLPALERHHDVLAPTLPGHAGGAPLPDDPRTPDLADAVEAAMDEAGFETAHVVGNSLGGYVALELAARGRARTVTALAPAGGWAAGDASFRDALGQFLITARLVPTLLPFAGRLLATPEGRRKVTAMTTVAHEHLPPELLEHQLRGVVGCAVQELIAVALRDGWPLDAARIACPVRIVWGAEDRLLPWPSAAERFRREWLPRADWVVLDDVGHCPQLDVPTVAAELILGHAGD